MLCIIMVFQYRIIKCNKCMTLLGDADRLGELCREYTGTVLFAQLCITLKLLPGTVYLVKWLK